MNDWYSIHFYPAGTTETFLNKVLLPLCEESIWNTRGARMFFVRYTDDTGAHVRVRFKGEADWMSKTLQPAIGRPWRMLGKQEEVPYAPEPDRFGGAEALAWAEEYFHISSRVALSRLSRPNHVYEDAMLDTLKLHTISGFSAGLSRKELAKYMDQLCTQWIKAFFTPEAGTPPEALEAAVRADLQETLAPQFAFIQDTLEQTYRALVQEEHDKNHPEWLRWQKGNELIFNGLGVNKDQAFPHLLHLTNNRMGINNQDEAYLLYVLSQVFQ